MIRLPSTRLAVVLLASLAWPAFAQNTARDAADAAEAVAARASAVVNRVDPDTDRPADDLVTRTYASLPPLVGADAPVAAEVPESPAPRGPAVRTIARPVVQALPAAPATAPAAVAFASSDPFVIKSILPIEGSIRYGDWFWDESAAPRTGKLVITVDLEARVISAFRDGHEIGTAVALLGTQQYPTPLGTFPILTKEKDNVSEKYDNAPMPHTLRLTWDGIAIHGSPVLNGYASHGCIGVPDEFAALLFAAAKRGDKVIITRGKMIGVGDKVM